jgi:hypothetical protein
MVVEVHIPAILCIPLCISMPFFVLVGVGLAYLRERLFLAGGEYGMKYFPHYHSGEGFLFGKLESPLRELRKPAKNVLHYPWAVAFMAFQLLVWVVDLAGYALASASVAWPITTLLAFIIAALGVVATVFGISIGPIIWGAAFCVLITGLAHVVWFKYIEDSYFDWYP